MDEIWKDIVGYEGYQVSNLGNVASLNYRCTGTRHNLRKGISKTGYAVVVLCDGEKQKMHYVHRLVAIAFIQNPLAKPEVNHIDGDKQNNSVSNLEWCSSKENMKHAHKLGLVDVSKAWGVSVEKSRKPVIQMDMRGNVLGTFSSISKAQREVHTGFATIVDCADGKRASAGGFVWRYADER